MDAIDWLQLGNVFAFRGQSYLSLYDCDRGRFVYNWPLADDAVVDCQFRADKSEMLINVVQNNVMNVDVYSLPFAVYSPWWPRGIPALAMLLTALFFLKVGAKKKVRTTAR